MISASSDLEYILFPILRGTLKARLAFGCRSVFRVRRLLDMPTNKFSMFDVLAEGETETWY